MDKPGEERFLTPQALFGMTQIFRGSNPTASAGVGHGGRSKDRTLHVNDNPSAIRENGAPGGNPGRRDKPAATKEEKNRSLALLGMTFLLAGYKANRPEEGFIAGKACDGEEVLAALGMTGFCAWRVCTRLGLIGFSGHGQEDGAQGEGAVLDIVYFAEEAADFVGSALFVEVGVDETDYGAGGFGLEPIWR